MYYVTLILKIPPPSPKFIPSPRRAIPSPIRTQVSNFQISRPAATGTGMEAIKRPTSHIPATAKVNSQLGVGAVC